MKLVFDIGNTAMKGALFSGGDLVSTGRLEHASAAADEVFEGAICSLAGSNRIARVGCVSVVPAATERLSRAVRSVFGLPLEVLTTRSPAPIVVEYLTPETLGTDRLAAAAAGLEMYGKQGGGPERSVLVIDAGTSTTFEVVSADGRYLGGAIAAGPRLIRSALHGGTAQLPLVDLTTPDSPLGRSTNEAIRSGVMFGYLGAVEGIAARLRREMTEPVAVVVTGGWGELLGRHLSGLAGVEPHLVLHGVRMMLDCAEEGQDRRLSPALPS
jgi:type III pantothenate kinase